MKNRDTTKYIGTPTVMNDNPARGDH